MMKVAMLCCCIFLLVFAKIDTNLSLNTDRCVIIILTNKVHVHACQVNDYFCLCNTETLH